MTKPQFDYIILRNSVEQAAWDAQSVPAEAQPDTRTFCGHKFKVIQGGYKPRYVKSGTMDRVWNGNADYQVGNVTYVIDYIIRTKEELDETDGADFGTLDDLIALFLLKNPSPTVGQPSNLITLVDHLGEVRPGFLIGEESPEPMTTTLVGVNAHYTVQVQFAQRDPL